MRACNQVMTMQEVAEYLKVAVRTVYGLVREGEIPVFKVGRVMRCRRSDVEAFISQQVDAKQLATSTVENGGRK